MTVTVRSARWAPLFGIAFVVLVVVGGPVLEQSLPDDQSSSSAVIGFFTAHQQRERLAVYVLAFAFVCYLLFAGVLRSRWRGLPGCEGPAAVLLAAAGIEVVGQAAGLGGVFALTADPAHLEPGAAQAMNLVANDMLVASAIGNLTFYLIAGLLILRGRTVVPRWLGWVAIVLAVTFVVPPIEFAGFFLSLVWVVIVSALLLRAPMPHPSAADPDAGRLATVPS